jgi:murein L,D-transpeptidase YafK
LLAPATLVAAIALAGCDTDNANPALSAKAMAPISQKTLGEMAQKNMSKESPILIRLFKQESELEVWKEDNSGHFALLHTFPICRWSGDLGPKVREGDRQAPEGFYSLTRGNLNPNSQYHLAFNIGFPNAYDKANDRSGAFLMIHGDCSSRGCYAMTDEQIGEIYALARESFFGGQRAFQIQAYPFRMTPMNLAKHRGNPNMPFWKMLKEGYDHFEVTRMEPKVDVCDKHYVFNASPPEGSAGALNFSPRGECPVYEVPKEIAAAVAEKKRKDEVAVADLIRRGTPAAPIKMATDGGMHEIFAEALQGGREVRGKDGEIERVAVTAPGTIPPTVNPPSNIRIAGTPAPAAAPTPSKPASRSVVARAPAKPSQAAPAAQPTQIAAATPAENSGNFLASLFSFNTQTQSPTASAAPATTAASKPKPASLRASATASARPATPPAAAPVAKQKPAATAVAEAKPTPLAEPEEAVAPRLANAGGIRPQSPVSAFSGVPANGSGSLLAGAAPVVPAGKFGGGWLDPR